MEITLVSLSSESVGSASTVLKPTTIPPNELTKEPRREIQPNIVRKAEP
jgi:hypothetical protein